MPEKDPKDSKTPEPPKAEGGQHKDEENLDKVAGGLGLAIPTSPIGSKDVAAVCLSQT
jgi:hypothetical protein